MEDMESSVPRADALERVHDRVQARSAGPQPPPGRRRRVLSGLARIGGVLAMGSGCLAPGAAPPRTAAGEGPVRPSGAPSAAGGAPAPSPAPATFDADGILHTEGERIVDGGGRSVVWRGVAFGNQVWQRRALPLTDHAEIDFERVHEMGMNAVRFYMFAGTFDDDAAPGVFKDAGWRWLDDNVAWARKHGIYLILNMHVPPGGFQSNGEGHALWDVPANQDRLVGLWRAIARRYAHEPVIGGYDILNEPGVPRAKTEWQALANRIVRAIREVDPRHIVIVERVNSIAKQWTNDADMNFVWVDDANVVYTFHFYEPFAYTHQFASWVHLGEGGAYPDETRVAHQGDNQWLGIAAFDSPTLPPGDSPWTHSVGPRLAVPVGDARVKVGHLSLVAANLGGGRAFFDDLVVEDFDAEGNLVGEILRVDLRELGGWYLWTANGSGSAGVSSEGHGAGGMGSLSITGTSGDANLGSWQTEFIPRPGHAYALSGWMKGKALPAGARVQIRLDLLGSSTPVLPRDRAYLESELDRYMRWGHQHHVPLFLGEFGLNRPCFEAGRGGLAWVTDMLDLAQARGLSFTYHAYHEDAFGLYSGSGPVDPAHANQPLIELFSLKLCNLH
jgi:endoglucanase